MNEQPKLFDGPGPEVASKHLARLLQAQEGLPERLYLGTSSWANEDWEGLIYPPGCASQDYLEHYARIFRMVEVDMTWYRIPSLSMVEGWLRRTPEHFRFAVKVPRVISHEKQLVDCLSEMETFVKALRPLGGKLGPLLLQFGYVARGEDAEEYQTGTRFIHRLDAFLEKAPTDDCQLAVEVRNAKWLGPALLEVLRQHRAALVYNHYYTMPEIGEVVEKLDPVTADFLYVRFLGNRKQIENQVSELLKTGKKNRRWNELLLDRHAETQRWAATIQKLAQRPPGHQVYVLFNNHFAGYAPGSLELFARAWKDQAGNAMAGFSGSGR